MAVRPPTRVLVAEDDPDIASLLEHYLKKASFLPTVVHSGRDVLPQLKREMPDLVVLDLMLPGLDGLSLCTAIRADASTAAIPIIRRVIDQMESEDGWVTLGEVGMRLALPITKVTAMVSPKARPSPSMMPPITPFWV